MVFESKLDFLLSKCSRHFSGGAGYFKKSHPMCCCQILKACVK
jgi:hypothetical protein